MFPKQEEDKTKRSNSRQWSSRYRNPRIVRVSSTFGGKDRHSKVCTIRGLRDRRIRLSVPTAIQLYDLQDKLDLGQPSKVIDWLLNLAKDDIDKLPPLPFPLGLGFDHMLLDPQETSSIFPPNQNPLSFVSFLDRDCENKEKGKWVIASDGQSSSSSSSSFSSVFSSHNDPSSSFSGFPNAVSAMAFNQHNFHCCPPSLSLSQIGNHTHHSSQKAKWVIASDGHSSSSSFSTFSSQNNPSSSFPGLPNIGSTMAFNQQNFHFCPPSLSLSQIGNPTHHSSQNDHSINNGNSTNHPLQPLPQLILYPQASIIPSSIPFQPFPLREELEDSSRKNLFSSSLESNQTGNNTRAFQQMFANATNFGDGQTHRNDEDGEEDHDIDGSRRSFSWRGGFS